MNENPESALDLSGIRGAGDTVVHKSCSDGRAPPQRHAEHRLIVLPFVLLHTRRVALFSICDLFIGTAVIHGLRLCVLI